MYGKELPAAIKLLTRELSELRKERQSEFDWIRSQCGLATKHDLEKLGELIMSKLSTELDELRAQVRQGVGEVVAKITALETAQGDRELSTEERAAMDALKADVKVLSDIVPDETTPPDA